MWPYVAYYLTNQTRRINQALSVGTAQVEARTITADRKDNNNNGTPISSDPVPQNAITKKEQLLSIKEKTQKVP